MTPIKDITFKRFECGLEMHYDIGSERYIESEWLIGYIDKQGLLTRALTLVWRAQERCREDEMFSDWFLDERHVAPALMNLLED